MTIVEEVEVVEILFMVDIAAWGMSLTVCILRTVPFPRSGSNLGSPDWKAKPLPVEPL